ncbi:MAG: hypothetical protein QXL86_02195 [Candidatus Aenigmatarchaeota archaeon]
MSLKQSKGLTLTTFSIVASLFAIGIIALLAYIFLSRYLEVHLFVNEVTVERNSINLANVLISHENLTYVKDGVIQRGVLDAKKLDKLDPRKLDVAYPNSLIVIKIIDLEKCQPQGNSEVSCDSWFFVKTGPTSTQALSIVKFGQCLFDNIDDDIWGKTFRFFLGYVLGGTIGGTIASLWQPHDIAKCVANTIPSGFVAIFNTNPMVFRGLPILIRYDNGELHLGRIIVGVVEFV